MVSKFPKWVLFACLLGFGLMWGLSIPITKITVESGHHPIGLIFWQLVLSVVLMAPIALFRRSKLSFDRKHVIFFLIVALVGTIVPNGFSYLANFHLPGGVMALNIAMVPLFSLTIALVLRLETFQAKRAIGVLCGAVAVAMLILPEAGLPDPSKWMFIFVALIAPFAYGLEGNYLALSQPKDTGPIATVLGAGLVGVIVCLPLVWLTGTYIDPFEGMGRSEFALMGNTALHVIAYLGYIWLVGQAGPVFASQVAYIVTPAGVILSSLILGEQHSPWLWASLAVMLFALSLVQPKKARR